MSTKYRDFETMFGPVTVTGFLGPGRTICLQLGDDIRMEKGDAEALINLLVLWRKDDLSSVMGIEAAAPPTEDIAETVARHETLIQGLKSAVADLSDELVTVRAALREQTRSDDDVQHLSTAIIAADGKLHR